MTASIGFLDLWIAGTMSVTEDARGRLHSAGGAWASAEAAALRAKQTRLSDPFEADRSIVLELFGPPLREENGVLLFSLVLWPDHQYEWRVAPSGGVLHNGFLRRANTRVPAPARHSLVGFQEAFKPWLHTSTDVVDALGPASREDGWWPESTLFYGVGDGENTIAVTFDHELLCSIAEDRVPK